MRLSALTNSLPLALPDAIRAIADLGLRRIDVPPTTDPAAREALRSADLRVACVRLEHEQPAEIDLASSVSNARRDSVDYFRRRIECAEELDSPTAYLTPPVSLNPATLARWTDSLVSLADTAQSCSLRLCLEHFPGRALPTVEATLYYLDKLKHPALALLIDVGHCLISQENAAQAVVEAGDRLGYVHFDDNDGVGDLHWALLDGRLTEEQIVSVVEAMQSTGYDGGLCLELNSSLDEPLENLRRSHDVLQRCVRRVTMP